MRELVGIDCNMKSGFSLAELLEDVKKRKCSELKSYDERLSELFLRSNVTFRGHTWANRLIQDARLNDEVKRREAIGG
jgi:hypothetical protein